jgi:hypothetical protein
MRRRWAKAWKNSCEISMRRLKVAYRVDVAEPEPDDKSRILQIAV